MTIAVIETGGKQYRVAEGDLVDIELLKNADSSKGVIFEKVLMVGEGKDIKLGNPYVEGSKVEGVIEKEDRQKKILVTKFKNKTRYFKRYGHRQPFHRVKITKIV